MAAVTRAGADRQALEQFVAAKQRLAQLQQVALPREPDAKLLAHGAGPAVAADETGRANLLSLTFDAAQARGHSGVVLPQADEFPTETHPQAGHGFGNRLQQRLERILRDQLI